MGKLKSRSVYSERLFKIALHQFTKLFQISTLSASVSVCKKLMPGSVPPRNFHIRVRGDTNPGLELHVRYERKAGKQCYRTYELDQQDGAADCSHSLRTITKNRRAEKTFRRQPGHGAGGIEKRSGGKIKGPPSRQPQFIIQVKI